MATPHFLSFLGEETTDVDEEAFVLFSRPALSQNLGFIDPLASSLDVNLGRREYIIRQSPGLLSSDRDRGTTGAVLWKVTPVFAEWIASNDNPLFSQGILGNTSLVLELGCGTSGLLALVLAPKVKEYIATDQAYVMRILNENISENTRHLPLPSKGPRNARRVPGLPTSSTQSNIRTLALDWEDDIISQSLLSNLQDGHDHSKRQDKPGFDAIIACDCIFNEALIAPLTSTFVDACRLRAGAEDSPGTVCIIAQQLRSADVFEEWLRVFMRSFMVWRVPDHLLSKDLALAAGFVVHVGVLKLDDE